MKPYADPNLFTRLYLDLPGSDVADALVELARSGTTEPLSVSWLHRVETTNAVELSVVLGEGPVESLLHPASNRILIERVEAL